MDFDDEYEYQFADSNIEVNDEDEEKDENLQDDFREGASEEQINEEEAHFENNIKPHILDTIRLLTSFIIFKDDEELSFEENTEVYAAKRKACIESLQDLQEITQEDLTKRERRVWTLLIETNIHKNELFSLLSHHRNDYDIVREVVDLLVILSESPDQNNPRFRKFSARGGASERKRAILYFGKQMKVLQRFKQTILSSKFMPIITWTLMNKEKESALKSKMMIDEENKKRVLTEADLYCIVVFKLLNNLLSIPDAKYGKVLQTEEIQTRMQDVLVKQLQNDCQFLDYALVKITKFVANYDEVSSQSEMKRLQESYLLFTKFATMLFWNESVKDLFEASNPIIPGNTDIVMSQNEENMEMDNSELKRLLRKEKMYKDQVKSLILTSRHSRFQGNLLERQSNVSKVISKNKDAQKLSALLEENEEYDAEKENKKNDVKIQKTFVVQNVNHMNTAHMYAASDNPFLVGGGQQKASSTGARFGTKRFNVMSDRMELRFSPSSLETRKLIKNFADDLYRGCFNTLIQLSLQTIIKQQEDSIAINNELDQKSTKEALDHESERNFLYLGQFMLGYNRYKYLQKKKREEQRSTGETVGFDIALISTLLKEGVVSMIFKKLLSDYVYTQNTFNLTFVVGFLRELFTTFRWMGDKKYSGSDAFTWGRIVSIHLHHILYDPTNMESIVRLVREYKPYQNSIKYLSQLVSLVDLFVTVINENISIESFFMKSKKGESSTTEDDEEEEENNSAKQKRFELDGFRRRFANPSVLKQYMYLFRFYDVNPPEVNQAIIQIFKYIIEELDMEFMMFRASFLKLCFNILSNKTFIHDSLGTYERKVNEEVIAFVLSIVKNFFKRVDEDPFTVCETLHWSTMGEVNLLNHADFGRSASEGRASRPAEADDLDGFIQSEEEEDALEAIKRDEARGVDEEEEIQPTEEKKEKKKKNKKKNKKKRETEEGAEENQEENQEEAPEEETKKKKKKDKKKDKKKKDKKKSKKRKERDEEETEETEKSERSEKKKKKKKKKEKQLEESLQEEEEPQIEQEMADEDRLLLSSDDSDDEKSRGRLKKVSQKRVLPNSILNLDFEDE